MKLNSKHKLIETFHFSAALNVLMILLIFVTIIFAAYFKYGIKIHLGYINEIGLNEGRAKMITINANDDMYLANEKISFVQLQSKLELTKNESYVIRPGSSAGISLVENVISELKKSGVKNITIQTDLSLF